MPASIIAAARTPWAPRHGSLAGCSPEDLAATAIAAAAGQRDLGPSEIDLVVLACDTIIGAQALNLARRATLALGWDTVPAVTIDGQGIADLAAVDLAARYGGVSVVAAVDVTSTVPPGAALVRDYGRPMLDEPEIRRLERLAGAAGLDRESLDRAVTRQVDAQPAPTAALAAVRTGATQVETDAGAPTAGDVAQLEPLCDPDGLLTAAHTATLADGAAALVIESDPADTGRAIVNHLVAAGPADTELERLQAMVAGPTALADSSVVVHELLRVAEQLVEIPSVLALGSVPSGDGLRMLVDAFHAVPTPCTVLRRGQGGQLASVSLADQKQPTLP